MYDDPRRGNQLRHDTCDPDAWGQEMLVFLRDHDADFERWRHEQLERLDADYRDFRRERFSADFGRWRAQRAAATQEQRSGRVDPDSVTPAIGMPLGSDEMPPGGGTITPDAGARQRQAAVEAFHAAAGSGGPHAQR